MKLLYTLIILFAFSFAEDESEYYFGNSCKIGTITAPILEFSSNYHYFEHNSTKNRVTANSCKELLSLKRDKSYKFVQIPCNYPNEGDVRNGQIYSYRECVDSTTISDCISAEKFENMRTPKKSYIKKEGLLKEIYSSKLDSSLFRFELSNNLIDIPSYNSLFNHIELIHNNFCDDSENSHFSCDFSIIFNESSIEVNSYSEFQSISLFGICDYNEDGYQDVLIEYNQRYNQGTGYSGYTAIFTKKSASSKFELIDQILEYSH